MRHAAIDVPWVDVAEEKLPGGSLRRIALLSVLTLVVGFGGFTAWAALTQVESAVPASGVVVSGGKRKTVSLLDSGILQRLEVREGDHVAAGQVLLRLDDAQVQTTLLQARVQYWTAVARAARLSAEAADRRDWAPTPALRDAAAAIPDIAAALGVEQDQFRTRWVTLDSTIQVSQRKIAQQQAQIAVLRAQVGSVAKRLALTQDETRGVDFLMARGLSTKTRQLDLQRTEVDLASQVDQLDAQLVQAMQTIAQIQSEIANTLNSRRSDIAHDQADTQAAQADAQQRMSAAQDLIAKKVISAPEAGTVTDVKFFTPGSSIVSGQPVMDIVPAADRLLVEGTVAPNEVERLAVGQRVNVRLTAYKSHRVPVIPGRLVYVGADRQMDPSNQPMFLIRAEIDPAALADKPGVVLLPGMPADVLVINGARSVLSFLVSPITDSLEHSLREQ